MKRGDVPYHAVLLYTKAALVVPSNATPSPSTVVERLGVTSNYVDAVRSFNLIAKAEKRPRLRLILWLALGVQALASQGLVGDRCGFVKSRKQSKRHRG